MKKALKVILIVFIGVAAIGAAGVLYITNGLKAGENLEISPVTPAHGRRGV
jgi:flagellar basal body-associated protein FliL